MSAKVTVNGKTLTERVWALIEDAKLAAKLPSTAAARVVQGSWSEGSKSAGTHSGGGAIDLSVRGLNRDERLRLVHELRKRRGLAWLRTPEFGWNDPNNEHIHVIVEDEPELSWSAKAQVAAYKLGLNGLASRKKDPHPRPKRLSFKRPEDVILKDLRYGKTNGSVRALQKALGLSEDGFYGPRTDTAVRKHQLKHKLYPVDRAGRSYVGPKQAKILGLG